ncbi:hypothetical protein BT93_D1149 [Corymbia citriodora subsp. variegata]|nr:hypothetical protein BT93_D1149 [Corymbia citriodora subsp. variegata]
MPSVHNSWNLSLSGMIWTSHDPLAVVTLLVTQQPVLRQFGGSTTVYGYPTELARISMFLPPAFLQLPAVYSFHIERVLNLFGIDRPNQRSFAMRILRATQGLSRLHPRGIHMTAILNLTSSEISEVEDLGMREGMERPDSETGRVMRDASKSAILRLKEKFYDAEDKDCCSICLEEFHRTEKVTELPCSHVFHRRCIIRWLEDKNSCPLCRCQLDT